MQVVLSAVTVTVKVPERHNDIPSVPGNLLKVAAKLTMPWRSAKTNPVFVLNNVTASFKPASFTLILGSPGSGEFQVHLALILMVLMLNGA